MLDQAAIVLAGGRSRRMGTDKALLPLGRDSMLSRVINNLRPVFADMIVVTNTPEQYRDLKVRLVRDIVPGRGPLSGIHAGLMASTCRYNFIVSCDMPFVYQKLVRHLLSLSPGYDVTVPRYRGLLQPLHAVYTRGCLPAIEECLVKEEYKTTAFYTRVKVRYVEEDELAGYPGVGRAFFNVNTPADMDLARDLTSVPVISVVGRSGTGKTTLITKLLPELKRRGYRVATIKHDVHGFEIDHPGKDTYRHAEAGADVVAISSPGKLAVMEKTAAEVPLDCLVERIQNVDLIITEGYKRENKPKIEVHRSGVHGNLISRPEELLAVATDEPLDTEVPCFSLDDVERIVDFIETEVLYISRDGGIT